MRECEAERPAWGAIKLRGTGLFAATFPLLLLFYLFSPLGLVQFLALLFLVVLLLSRFYSEYLIRHLRLARRDRELRGFRNEWIEVELSVENYGRLPAFMLALGDSPGILATFRNNKMLCTLGGKRRQSIHWQGYGSARGCFTLGPASLRGADPLGIFPFTLTASETARLFVYPAPALVDLDPPGGLPLGALITARPFHEDLTRTRSLREYYSGDELRRINWKATARAMASGGGGPAGGLMVNEYESTLSYPLAVFLNADPAEYPLKTRELHFERAIEAAAALCLMASREVQNLGIIIHTRDGAEDSASENISPGAFTLIPILERLVLLERRKTGTEEACGNAEEGALRGSTKRMLREGKFFPFGTRLIYCGPALEERDFNILESLRSYHISLEYLIIDERALPPNAGPFSRRYAIKEYGYEIF